MVRDYEVVFITAAELTNEEQADLLARVRGFVERFEGQICQEYLWGRRKLAYPIKKKEYGVYHLWYVQGEGPMLEELERQFGFSENVIRAQTVKIEDWQQAAAKFESLTEVRPVGTESPEEESPETTEDAETTETTEA